MAFGHTEQSVKEVVDREYKLMVQKKKMQWRKLDESVEYTGGTGEDPSGCEDGLPPSAGLLATYL